MLCFSPWISDVELKFNIGYICIGFVVIHLLVNLSIIFGATVSILKQRFRMYMAMRHLKKYRQQRQAELRSKHRKMKQRLVKL